MRGHGCRGRNISNVVADAGSSECEFRLTSCPLWLDLLADLDDRIAELEREIARRDWGDETARRLMTIPGIGPITATALTALAPAAEPFAKGRDFAAWLQGASTDGSRPRTGLSEPDH
ncbi:hypothetical protein OICFNHDK_1148 [Methylobacterium bullatum]|uniref:Transposase IS116/IS110/IS902 C-terminal domain-containing protein n=1 Tax=Methylobacterium bullatum TaxID=570505 RepID=A0AAV4Z4X2_9HYPH|nr:hypothetical protein OICFNHDK_1148 [Methylobacterium bullatum]